MARTKTAQETAVRRSARASAATRRGRSQGPVGPFSSRLTLDEAVIALLIGAMDANRHVSREELARAHHIIWSMKRYRRKPGAQVGRLIDAMRTAVEEHGALAIITAAARVIPAQLRPAAFAVAADLVLADGKMEPAERRFLDRLGDDLALEPDTAARLLTAMLVKNSI